MFTGIVEERGSVRAFNRREGGARLEFESSTVLDDAGIGASIAVNGCCLTVAERGEDWWAADAQVETLDRTTLGSLEVGDAVNLERSVRLMDRLGGHLVQGHVDGRGRIAGCERLGDGSVRLRVEAPATLLRYVVEKGSIAVDGVSLTVAAVDDTGFDVALVAHTLEVTTLGSVEAGRRVNLEVDIVAKYIERLATADSERP
jgi:riboflavin synthase